MDQTLIEAMKTYLNAGLEMDLEKMDAIYASDFENVRMDHAGNVITISKEQFMQRFRAMVAQGVSHESIDDVEYLSTSIYDNHGSVLIRRVKENSPVLYNFVWRVENGKPTTMVREFTVSEDITYLIQMVKAAQANTQ